METKLRDGSLMEDRIGAGAPHVDAEQAARDIEQAVAIERAELVAWRARAGELPPAFSIALARYEYFLDRMAEMAKEIRARASLLALPPLRQRCPGVSS